MNELGGGALLDIGCYTLNPLTWIFGEKLPDHIIANGVLDEEYNVDIQNAITVRYKKEGKDKAFQFGQISMTSIANTINEYVVCGTTGKIVFRSPGHKCTELVLYKYDDRKRKDIVSEEVMRFELPNVSDFKYGFNFRRSQGFIYQIDTVLECLDNGLVECPEYTWNEMMVIMKVMDEIRRQIGLKYPADKHSKL